MSQLTPADPAIAATVCVVNWNGARWLPECLASLRKVEGVSWEAIVVDNASSDDSASIIRKDFSEVRLLVNAQNLGFAKANNQAIRLGRGRYFFLLNNDAALCDGSLESLVRFLDEHPRAGMVAGRLENPDGSTQFLYYPVALPSLASLAADMLWLNRIWPRGHLGRGRRAREWDPSKASPMEQIPGACMMVRRELLESVGLFDEGYEFLFEDVDLCARSPRANWEIWYTPDASILHRGGASSQLLDVSARSLRRFRGMLRYAGSHFDPVRFLVLRIIVVLVLLLRLPVVVLARLVAGVTGGERWKGAVRAYLQLLGETMRARGRT